MSVVTKKIKCIDSKGFNFISNDTIYPIIKETRDFYYITNNSGMNKKYGKKRFELVENPAVVEEKPKPKPVRKKTTVLCMIPSYNKLLYKKEYTVIREDKNNKDNYMVLGENKEEISVSKKRFK